MRASSDLTVSSTYSPGGFGAVKQLCRSLLLPLLCSFLLLLSVSERALAASDNKVSFVLETGSHLGTIKALSLSPDERFVVTGSDDKTIRIWSARNGGLVKTIRGQSGEGRSGQVYALDISADGTILAAAGWFDDDDATEPCCGDIRLYDFASGQQIGLLVGHTNAVYAVTFSPDKALFASAGAGGQVNLWSVGDKKLNASFTDEELGCILINDRQIG